ncbi:MAG: hypothetical protein RL607_250 [Bacteroidota bacterium]|jgi:hypothetical protein
MKSQILFLLAFFLSNSIFSQSIEKYWERFNSEKWIVKYTSENSEYHGMKTHGILSFSNIDTKNVVQFHVFLKSEINNEFDEKMQIITPTINCNMDTNQTAIKSFFWGDYYYMLDFCIRCFVAEDKECERLSLALNKYIGK